MLYKVFCHLLKHRKSDHSEPQPKQNLMTAELPYLHCSPILGSLHFFILLVCTALSSVSALLLALASGCMRICGVNWFIWGCPEKYL